VFTTICGFILNHSCLVANTCRIVHKGSHIRVASFWCQQTCVALCSSETSLVTSTRDFSQITRPSYHIHQCRWSPSSTRDFTLSRTTNIHHWFYCLLFYVVHFGVCSVSKPLPTWQPTCIFSPCNNMVCNSHYKVLLAILSFAWTPQSHIPTLG
jgi:hypothetical protein